jgi:hypothetical protein
MHNNLFLILPATLDMSGSYPNLTTKQQQGGKHGYLNYSHQCRKNQD